MALRENSIVRYGMRRLWRRGVVAWPGLVLFVVATMCLTVSPCKPNVARPFYFGALAFMMLVPPIALLPWMACAALAREHESRSFEALRLTLLTDTDIAFGSLVAVVAPLFYGQAVTIPISILSAGVYRAPGFVVVMIYAGAIVVTLSTALFGLWMGACRRSTLGAAVLSYFTIGVGGLVGMLMLPSLVFSSRHHDVWGAVLAACFLLLIATGISWAGVLAAVGYIPGRDEAESYRYRAMEWVGADSGRSMEELKSDGIAKF